MRLRRKNRNILYRTAFWTAIVLLFVASSVPDIATKNLPVDQNDQINFRFDYLYHAIAYGIIGFLYVNAYQVKITGILLLAGYAAIEEAHQYWIPGRTLNPVDFGFDLAGLGFVLLLWFLLAKRKSNIVSDRFYIFHGSAFKK